MPPTGKPTVFFARDKPNPSDSTHSPMPSIEDDDTLVHVASDIMDGESNAEEGEAGTRARSENSTVTEEVSSGPPSPKEREAVDKKPQKPVKGKRQRIRPSTVRRSTRISSIVPPKKAEPLAAKAPAKRGRRGRPPTKTKTAAAPRQKEWEVEKVIGSQIDAVTSEHFYLVKWKGYSVKENTWEPKKNLGNCRNLIRDFEKTMSKGR